jgi:hypothetical protein
MRQPVMIRTLATLMLVATLTGCERPHPCVAAHACTRRPSPADADLIGVWSGPGGGRLVISAPDKSATLPFSYNAAMKACGLPLHADPVAHPLVRSYLSGKGLPRRIEGRGQRVAWDVMAWGPDGEGENADIQGLELKWFGYDANSPEPALMVGPCRLARTAR